MDNEFVFIAHLDFSDFPRENLVNPFVSVLVPFDKSEFDISHNSAD